MIEELFRKFLDEYLENVRRELPESYRARQLKTGGTPKDLVYEFETRFLKKPFEKAIKKYTRELEKYKQFHDHIKAHFEKEHPDWEVVCKICKKTFREITGDKT